MLLAVLYFLLQPVRVEELRNVWQHVVRRRSLHHSRAADEHSGLEDHVSLCCCCWLCCCCCCGTRVCAFTRLACGLIDG